MEKLSTYYESENCWVNSQHVVVVVGKVVDWLVCATEKGGETMHRSDPHVKDILNSELPKLKLKLSDIFFIH